MLFIFDIKDDCNGFTNDKLNLTVPIHEYMNWRFSERADREIGSERERQRVRTNGF